jgi:hypothetical protein
MKFNLMIGVFVNQIYKGFRLFAAAQGKWLVTGKRIGWPANLTRPLNFIAVAFSQRVALKGTAMNWMNGEFNLPRHRYACRPSLEGEEIEYCAPLLRSSGEQRE